MSIKITDRWKVKKQRATPALVFKFFETNPPARLTDSKRVIDRVYALSEAAGIDFALAVSRIADETGALNGPSFLVSDIYRERLNIGGLGVTDGGDEMISFDTPEQAADAYMAHLFTYVLGSDFDVLGVTKDDDPRFDATPKAWRGSVETLDGLRGKWFTNEQGAINSAARGNRIFPGIPDQENTPVTMPTIPVHWTPIRAGAVNNPSGLLLPGPLIIVWHENGNPNSDADDEARFLLNGGGEHRVSYTFAVDHEKAHQFFHCGELCHHAADGCDNPATDRGCFRGVPIEHCQDRDPAKWEATKRNGAILTAMIIAGHPSIHFGGREGDFSADRIETHRAVSDTKKWCPEWMLNEGAIPSQTARVKAFLAMDGTPSTTTTPPPTKPTYPKTPKPPTQDEVRYQGLPPVKIERAEGSRWTCIQGTAFRTYPHRDAPEARKPARRGRTYTLTHQTTIGSEAWLVTLSGHYALKHAFEKD